MRWQTGVSGNPKGRPGQRNKRTELRGLLEEKAPELVGKAIELALGGDSTALRLCLERVLPALKSTDIPATLPDLSGSLTDQGQAVLQALSGGKGRLRICLERIGRWRCASVGVPNQAVAANVPAIRSFPRAGQPIHPIRA